MSHDKAPSAISEAELVAAHMGRSLQARPCVCGSVVIADPLDPTPGVKLHQATVPHMAWRWWMDNR